MSKFEIGNRVKYKKLGRAWCIGTVTRIVENKVYCDWSDGFRDSFMYENDLVFADDTIQTKPAQKHTETERKKAAKAVLALQEKLKAACDKAKETGIHVEFVNQSIGMIDVQMDYQPPTPKKRVYK